MAYHVDNSFVLLRYCILGNQLFAAPFGRKLMGKKYTHYAQLIGVCYLNATGI
jgi:hypothetical protein